MAVYPTPRRCSRIPESAQPDDHRVCDYRGNRQLLTTGNLKHNDRVALFLMDYANRNRLKILGHARVFKAEENLALAANLTDPEIEKPI